MSDFTPRATHPPDAPPAAAPIGGLARRSLPAALDPVFTLLLAIADDELASSAIRVAAELAHSKGAVPTVLQALGEDREMDLVISPFIGAVAEERLSPEYRNEFLDSLQKRVGSVIGEVRWRFEIADQSPADAVVELARQLSASLIVMGLRHHSVLHRAVSRDMLRAVLRATRLPVLAVRPELEGLPRRIVVAVDFGEASVRAANLARHLLADDGAMYLVHVATDHLDIADERISPLRVSGTRRITEELDRLIEDLSPAPGMTITPIIAEGDVLFSIDGCARRVDADLLAVGSDHHSPLDRLLSGSVSMGLAHSASRSMLIVPARHNA